MIIINILVIDGQGGRIGRQIVEMIINNFPEHAVTAVGTNATATAAMLKGGAHNCATGENPVVVACRKADIIIGPIGVVIADSLLGEVTEKMALAVSRAEATRILIPMARCNNMIAGVSDKSVNELIEDVKCKINLLSAKGLEKCGIQ